MRVQHKLDLDELKPWVRRHRACWEILPLVGKYEGRRPQAGLELQVFAQRSAPGEGDVPTQQDDRLLSTLRRLIELALPDDSRQTQFRVTPRHGVRYLRSETGWAPEVCVRVEICHKRNPVAPPDLDEREMVDAIERNLSEPGLRKKAWPRARAA
jgi:hypothetical protein